MKRVLILASLALAETGLANSSGLDVVVRPEFFNPSLRQEATLVVRGASGPLEIEVLDRDGFVVRRLTAKAGKGPLVVKWDGRDGASEVVPDEAYCFRIRAVGGKRSVLLDPLKATTEEIREIPTTSYSRNDGVLTYRLPWPARVHLQAGQAVKDPRTNRPVGPVLKTIVDRAPRASGAVVERWNGFDESGSIEVAELPNFVVGVLATRLPTASVITTGNRKTSFREYAKRHRPAEALAPRKREPGNPAAHAAHRHTGLSAFEDQSPALVVEAMGPVDSPTRRFRVRVPEEAAPWFLSLGTSLQVFVDEKPTSREASPANPAELDVDLSGLKPGDHRIAFNWTTGSGPVATGAIRVRVAEKEEKK